MHCTRSIIGTLVLAIFLTAPALAGPPLICHVNDIGSARSLPWLATNGWNGADPNYELSHLTADTLVLLGPQTAVVVRMETIRRAVVYATHRAGLAQELELALFARALDMQGNGTPTPSALFDAGYFVETVRNAQRVPRIFANLPTQNVDGLALIRDAQRLGGSDMGLAVAAVEQARAEAAKIRRALGGESGI